jgi:hypothetical protein
LPASKTSQAQNRLSADRWAIVPISHGAGRPPLDCASGLAIVITRRPVNARCETRQPGPVVASGSRDGYRGAKRQGKPDLFIAHKPRKIGRFAISLLQGARGRLRPIHCDA